MKATKIVYIFFPVLLFMTLSCVTQPQVSPDPAWITSPEEERMNRVKFLPAEEVYSSIQPLLGMRCKDMKVGKLKKKLSASMLFCCKKASTQYLQFMKARLKIPRSRKKTGIKNMVNAITASVFTMCSIRSMSCSFPYRKKLREGFSCDKERYYTCCYDSYKSFRHKFNKKDAEACLKKICTK